MSPVLQGQVHILACAPGLYIFRGGAHEKKRAELPQQSKPGLLILSLNVLPLHS